MTPRCAARFQSTRPIRGATAEGASWDEELLNFNPRAPYGARHASELLQGVWLVISIHAPHTGRDLAVGGAYETRMISIHAPHTGRDPGGQQSGRAVCDFNPRAPYGARRRDAYITRLEQTISIHAPHTGRDRDIWAGAEVGTEFQSTRPIRGATPLWARWRR